MAVFDLNDDSVVVIIGTGAGGGVLANELAQKGVKVVALEAGGRYLPEDCVNDEWASLAGSTPHHQRQLARRQGFRRASCVDRQGGRRHHHALGRGIPALSGP